MKILFVTDLCPIQKDEKNLPETLLNFVIDFKKIGVETVVLRPNVIFNVFLRNRKIYPEKTYEYQNIKIINKNFFTPFFKPEQFNFLKNEKFDIIFAHMPCGILAANKISKVLKIPYIAAVHASDIKVLTDFKYSFLRKEMKKAYLQAEKIACRSCWLKDEIENIICGIKNKTNVIFSGIEPEALINSDDITKKQDDFFTPPVRIFSAGNLIKRKNFDLIIKALKKTENFELFIAGEGKEKKHLQLLVKKLNLQNRVKFMGRLDKQEIYNQMKTASIFVLVSSNETFGMVYLEALANGCIVVCKKNSGMAGFIKDGQNGFLLDENEDLALVLNKIKELKHPEFIMKNALNTAKNMQRLKAAQNYLNLI